jgi:hypothetical protein
MIERYYAHLISSHVARDATEVRRWQSIATAQLTAYQYLARCINTMNLEDVLRKVQSDRGGLLHGRLLDGMSRSTTSSWHDTAAAGPSTPSFHRKPVRPVD